MLSSRWKDLVLVLKCAREQRYWALSLNLGFSRMAKGLADSTSPGVTASLWAFSPWDCWAHSSQAEQPGEPCLAEFGFGLHVGSGIALGGQDTHLIVHDSDRGVKTAPEGGQVSLLQNTLSASALMPRLNFLPIPRTNASHVQELFSEFLFCIPLRSVQ